VTFDRFTVVRVPFPFTDRATTKNRPALVLSDALAFNTLAGHSVMDHRLVHGEIGQLSATDAAAVRQSLAQLLGLLP
jgi:mRNA interferase MazF